MITWSFVLLIILSAFTGLLSGILVVKLFCKRKQGLFFHLHLFLAIITCAALAKCFFLLLLLTNNYDKFSTLKISSYMLGWLTGCVSGGEAEISGKEVENANT